MALPSSGQLALSQISDEFGGGSRSNVSLRSLSSAAGLSTPDGFNEFYGLSAYTPPSFDRFSGSSGTVTGSGVPSDPYVVSFDPMTGIDDYGIYDWGPCAGNYYILQNLRGRVYFVSNTDAPQLMTMSVIAGSYTGPSTHCDPAAQDYVAFSGEKLSQAFASTNDSALSQAINFGEKTSYEGFVSAVGNDFDAFFYAEKVVQESGPNFGVTGVKMSIYFELA